MGDALTKFLAAMIADGATDLAAEHVENDARLARGEHAGEVIAVELRRVEMTASTVTVDDIAARFKDVTPACVASTLRMLGVADRPLVPAVVGLVVRELRSRGHRLRS